MEEGLTWAELFASYDIRLWIGLLVTVVIFVIELVLVAKGCLCSSDEKRRERARKAGRMITAKRISSRYKDREPEDKTVNRLYIADYEYQFQGKRREKQVITRHMEPPVTITIYYDKNGKTFTDYDGGKGWLQIFLYLIPIAAGLLVARLLGYTG